jgi:hypothetical protein
LSTCGRAGRTATAIFQSSQIGRWLTATAVNTVTGDTSELSVALLTVDHGGGLGGPP